MRAHFGKITLTALLIASMAAYGTPLALATAAPASAGSEGAPQAVEAGEESSSSEGPTVEYTEGEALVLLAQDAVEDIASVKTKSAKKTQIASLLDEDSLTVESLWDFGTLESGTSTYSTASASAQSDDVSQAVEVALVSSDTLSAEELVASLSENDAVEAATLNYKKKAADFTAQDYSTQQWNLSNTGQNGGTAGESTNTAAITGKTSTSEEQVVAVIDSGANYNHADLKDQMWVNETGKLAGTYGYDFAYGDDDPMDGLDHGTHCAGIIAAADDGVGVTGVDPNVKIMALKGLDDEGSGEDSSLIAAFNYVYRAMKLGVNVVSINCSWGGYGDNSIYNAIIEKLGQMGAVTCVAAGNESYDIDNLPSEITDDYGSNVEYVPAGCTSEYCVGVAAVDGNGELAPWSNYGGKSVDVAACGDMILSTVSDNAFNPSIYTAEQLEKLCSTYADFESESILSSIKVTVNDEVLSDAEKAKVLSIDSGEYVGAGTSGHSLSLHGAFNEGDVIVVSMPFTQAAAATKQQQASFMFRGKAPESTDDSDEGASSLSLFVAPASVTDTSDLEWGYGLGMVSLIGSTYDTWEHLVETASIANSRTTSYQIGFVLTANTTTTDEDGYNVRIDDIAVSDPMANSADFGTYDFMSGTSMATPHVTAAIAAVAAMQQNASSETPTALQTISELYNYTKANESLNTKTTIGAYLNFSETNNNPCVNSVTTSTKGSSTTVTVSGSNLNGATLQVKKSEEVEDAYKTISDVKASEDGTTMTFTDLGYLNYVVDLRVTGSQGFTTTKSNVYLVKGKATYKTLTSDKDYSADLSTATGALSSAVTDGTNVYGTNGTDIYRYNVKSKELDILTDIDGTNLDTLFGDNGFSAAKHALTLSNVAYVNGTLYALATYADVASSDSDYDGLARGDGRAFVPTTPSNSYYSQTILIKVNPKKDYEKLKRAADLPSSLGTLEGCSLASYNGKLCLFGGYNARHGTVSKAVYKLNASKATWSLDEGMTLPQGRAYSQALQVGNKLVVTLGLSGKDACPANLVYNGKSWKVSSAGLGLYNSTAMTSRAGTVYLFSGNIGLCKGGIQYVGMPAAGLGDTYTYSISKDAFVKGSVQYSTSSSDASIASAFVYGNTIYAVGTDGTVSSAKTSSGLVKVTATSSKKGKVTGTGTYAPGTKATVSAKGKKVLSKGKIVWYYVKSITVNGKKTSFAKKNAKRSVSFTVTADTKVKITYAKLKTKKATKK